MCHLSRSLFRFKWIENTKTHQTLPNSISVRSLPQYTMKMYEASLELVRVLSVSASFLSDYAWWSLNACHSFERLLRTLLDTSQGLLGLCPGKRIKKTAQGQTCQTLCRNPTPRIRQRDNGWQWHSKESGWGFRNEDLKNLTTASSSCSDMTQPEMH